VTGPGLSLDMPLSALYDPAFCHEFKTGENQ
jgi:hypothetical protein